MYRHLWWDFFQEIDPNYLPTVGGTCNWYEIFKREYIATRQWQRHQVRYHIVTFSPHGGWVRCLRFNQQRLYTGSHDCTVHVHNLSTHEWVATVKGHKAGVQCLQLISDETQNKDMLFTGSGDGSVRYLTLDCNRLQCVSSRGNGPQRRIFKSQVFHDYGESANVSVKSLLARSPDDLLLVGSEHIDVFKVSTKELMKRIVIDKGCRANALQTDNRYLYAALNNGKLVAIDLDSAQVVDSVVAHKAFFESFKIYRNVGLSAAADSSVKIWDLRTLSSHSQPHITFHFPNDRTLIGIQCDNYKLVCGGTSSVIYLCDLRKHEIVNSIPTDMSELDGTILDLQFDETQIVVCGQDTRTLAFKVSPILKHRVSNGHSPRFYTAE
jgi:WD40 repeat protein